MDSQTSDFTCLDDIEETKLGQRHSISKLLISEDLAVAPYPKLVPGTEKFTSGAIVSAHNSGQQWQSGDLACYSASNVTVAGWGNIIFGDGILTDTRVMPLYVKHWLGLPDNVRQVMSNYSSLNLREVGDTCVVLAGHGPRVYGHFLIETLFRLLAVAYIQGPQFYFSKFLLDASTPDWLLSILRKYFSIGSDRIVFFDPNFESVILSKAIIPGRVLRDNFFHPFCIRMIDDLKEFLPSPDVALPDRLFVTRGRYVNPQTPFRILTNEAELAEIAKTEFGITPIRPEDYAWHNQIWLFDSAKFVIGQGGSILHNAIFSRYNTTVASIGMMNSVQSEIGATFRHHMAYLNRNIKLEGEYYVDQDLFRDFLRSTLSAAANHSAVIPSPDLEGCFSQGSSVSRSIFNPKHRGRLEISLRNMSRNLGRLFKIDQH